MRGYADSRRPTGWRSAMPQTCPQCQSEAADGVSACPSCGASLSAGARPTQDAPPVSAPAPAAPAAAGIRRVVHAGLQVRCGPLVHGRPDRRCGHRRAVHLPVPVVVRHQRHRHHRDRERGVGPRVPLHRDDLVDPDRRLPRAARRLGGVAGRYQSSAPHDDDGGDIGQPRHRVHRLHLQARWFRRRLGVRCVPRADRCGRRRGALRVPQLRAKTMG